MIFKAYTTNSKLSRVEKEKYRVSCPSGTGYLGDINESDKDAFGHGINADLIRELGDILQIISQTRGNITLAYGKSAMETLSLLLEAYQQVQTAA